MRYDLFLGALAAFGLAVAVPAANAGLTGDTVHAVYLYPNTSTIYQDIGSAVVGASTPTFPNVINENVLNVNVTNSQIVFSWYNHGGTGPPPPGDTFDGIEFTDLTHAFTSASLDAATNTPGVSASNLTFSDGEILINWFANPNGIKYVAGENITIDVSTAGVPEPAIWLMLILGVAMIGIAVRRRNADAALAA